MSCSSHGGNPEVSVLMSCYNASRWLHEAIDSVLAQTLEDFEFILVDDGSTDETWNIIQGYRDRDQQIVAISKKNTGLADSLNIGIAQARGVWIARLDADDLCEPTRLEEQFDFVRNHAEVVLLGTGFVEIDEQGRDVKEHRYSGDHRSFFYHLERMQGFFPHSSAFYRSDLVKQLGGYNPRFKRAQDWDLWLRLAEHGRIGCLNEPLVRIRKHAEQISHEQGRLRQVCDGTAATVCHFLRKSGCSDPSLSVSETEWREFLFWIESCIEELGVFDRLKAWAEARRRYFAEKSPLLGVTRFGTSFLKSGHAFPLLWEKGMGSSLPKRLAREWMNSHVRHRRFRIQSSNR